MLLGCAARCATLKQLRPPRPDRPPALGERDVRRLRLWKRRLAPGARRRTGRVQGRI